MHFRKSGLAKGRTEAPALTPRDSRVEKRGDNGSLVGEYLEAVCLRLHADLPSSVNRSIPSSSIMRSHALLENPCLSTVSTGLSLFDYYLAVDHLRPRSRRPDQSVQGPKLPSE